MGAVGNKQIVNPVSEHPWSYRRAKIGATVTPFVPFMTFSEAVLDRFISTK
jgi:hypothetical protein